MQARSRKAHFTVYTELNIRIQLAGRKPYQVIFQQITDLGPGSVEAKGKKWGEKAKSTSEADCTNNCTIN